LLRLFLIGLLFSFCFSSYFQENKNLSSDKGELHLNIGLNYPKIGFTDSHGNQSLLSDFSNVSSNHLKLGYKNKLANKLDFMLSVSNNKCNALSRFELSSSLYNYVKYDLDYLTTTIALSIDVALPDNIALTPNIGLNYNYLISGFQFLNGNTYNLKENEDFVPFSFSLNPGFYLSKKISPYVKFNLDYNYIYELQSNEFTTEQVYSVSSHTVFVGTSISIASLKKENQRKKAVDHKIKKLEKSYAKIEQGIDYLRLYVDSLFIPQAGFNTKLQKEIEKFISVQEINKGPLEPDFVILFPSDSYQYRDELGESSNLKFPYRQFK
jgi:hypothetical protein